MTTASLGAACIAAVLVGFVAGRCLRGFHAGSVWALGLSASIGLVVLQSSSASVMLRILRPAVAADWLPWLIILATICSSIRQTVVRVFCGIFLATLIPVRLLWGSVWLPQHNIDLTVLAGMAVWSVALACSLLMKQPAAAVRISWKTARFGAAIAATTALFAASGSLTFGAATCVCGLAVLSVLVATSQIPSIAAVPILCLTGLSAAFSDLPLITAGLLLLSWIGLLTANRFSDQLTIPQHADAQHSNDQQGAARWMSAVARWTAVCALIGAVALTIVQQADSRNHRDIGSEHSSFGSELIIPMPASSINDSVEQSPAEAVFEHPQSSAATLDSSDPFAGLDAN
ncbi:MAG: hypothetical protein KDA96_10845 [Planctomycetaceae bacterium]|nr:hypothetical protein [Planctomycetaceae bacterium]